MNNKELEGKIREFIDIAEKLPERYREKCFEILLYEHLSSKKIPEKKEDEVVHLPSARERFTISIDVRAFLQQYNIPEENIHKLFMIVDNEIRPTYSIQTTKKAEAQIHLALMTALENALESGKKFEFSTEMIRQKCIDYKMYDRKNFKNHFKNNKKYFKDLADEEHVELSPDGKAELAEVMLELSK